MVRKLFIISVVALLISALTSTGNAQSRNWEASLSINTPLGATSEISKDLSIEISARAEFNTFDLSYRYISYPFLLKTFSHTFIISGAIENLFFSSEISLQNGKLFQHALTMHTNWGNINFSSGLLSSLLIDQSYLRFQDSTLTFSLGYANNMSIRSSLSFSLNELSMESTRLEGSANGLSIDYAVQFSGGRRVQEDLSLSLEGPGFHFNHLINRNANGYTSEKTDITPSSDFGAGITARPLSYSFSRRTGEKVFSAVALPLGCSFFPVVGSELPTQMHYGNEPPATHVGVYECKFELVQIGRKGEKTLSIECESECFLDNVKSKEKRSEGPSFSYMWDKGKKETIIKLAYEPDSLFPAFSEFSFIHCSKKKDNKGEIKKTCYEYGVKLSGTSYDTLNFGSVAIGQGTSAQYRIKCPYESGCTFDVRKPDSPFEILTPPNEFNSDPKQLLLKIAFHPQQQKNYVYELHIKVSNRGCIISSQVEDEFACNYEARLTLQGAGRPTPPQPPIPHYLTVQVYFGPVAVGKKAMQVKTVDCTLIECAYINSNGTESRPPFSVTYSIVDKTQLKLEITFEPQKAGEIKDFIQLAFCPDVARGCTYLNIEMYGVGRISIPKTFNLDFKDSKINQGKETKWPLPCNLPVSCQIEEIERFPKPPFYVVTRFGNDQQDKLIFGFQPQRFDHYEDTMKFVLCAKEECYDITVILTGTVEPQPPVASCKVLSSLGFQTTDDKVAFSGQDSYDPDGYIRKYNWDFGDKSTSVTDEAIITHNFRSEGTYTVALKVEDNDGKVSQLGQCDKTIQIRNHIKPAVDPSIGAAIGGAAGQIVEKQSKPQPVSQKGLAPSIDPATIVAAAGLLFYPVDQLLVQFSAQITSLKQAKDIISRVIGNNQIIGYFPPINAYLVRFPHIANLKDVAFKIAELDRIQILLQDRLIKDTQLSQWVIKNYLAVPEAASYDIDKATDRSAFEQIQVRDAWDFLSNELLNKKRKAREVKIAVIDTGIFINHANGEFSENRNIIKGQTYVKGSNSPLTDTDGHGTQIIGIIGAYNQEGRVKGSLMNGMASGIGNDYYTVYVFQTYLNLAEIDPNKVKQIEENGLYLKQIDPALASKYEAHLKDAKGGLGSPLSSILDSIRKAKDAGVSIINISLGWNFTNKDVEIADIYKRVFEAYMKYYESVLFVTSAGNGEMEKPIKESSPIELVHGTSTRHVPGGVNEPNNITVAALKITKENDGVIKLASYSNYGDLVDIAAPGSVFTTSIPRLGGVYSIASGTSFSAALVSGVSALLLAADPDFKLKPSSVKCILQKKVIKDKVDAKGLGLLNAYEAIKAVVNFDKDYQDCIK